MILETLKVLDVQRIGNTDEGIQAGINQESLPFIFELVSKQLYSNPIGSIIREITSNCFDSHIEAGVNDPVIIHKGYDRDEGYYIEFRDVGIGISPDRVETIYMNYFSSTKRGDNTQIGAFGIGSKTPLAYTDLFYITTIYNNIKYEYILHRGENKPTLELLNQEEVQEHNGTNIRIYIESGDVRTFEDQLKLQLTYFDNVWITGWAINNDYDIYEGKYFKFRSDISQSLTHIHICIGKVRYPIDLNVVKIDRNYHKIPVAIKFDIGELKVTPSREVLRYDDSSVKLIQERIELAAKEIIDIFNEQNPEIDTLEEFDKAIKNDNPRITFDLQKEHFLYIWANSGLSKNYKFKPLNGIGIKTTPNKLFFTWTITGKIYNGEYKEYISYDNSVGNNLIIEGNYVIFNKKEDRLSKYTNIFVAEKINRYSSIYIIEKKELDYDNITSKLGLKVDNSLGKAKIVLQYSRIIDNIVRERGKTYSECRPTDEWINEYQKSIRESSLAFIRKKNKKIFVRDITRGDYGREITEGELQSRTGILVYGFREDKALLQKINNTVMSFSKSIRKVNRSVTDKKREKAFMVLQIAQAVEKSVVGAKKTIYCKDFLKTKFVKKLETINYIRDSTRYYSPNNSSWLMERYIRDYVEDYHKLKSEYNFISESYSTYSIPLTEKYTDNAKIVEDFKIKYNSIVFPPLSEYINKSIINREEEKEFIEYLRKHKIKLRKEFYLKSQKQLKYEAGVKAILAFIKNPVVENNLLNYTLNQIENVKE